MIVNDLLISGVGFHLCVAITNLNDASNMIEQLYEKRQKQEDEPYPLFDGDNHLSGFVVPAMIQAMVIRPRVEGPDRYADTAFQLLAEQLKFYKAQNARMEGESES